MFEAGIEPCIRGVWWLLIKRSLGTADDEVLLNAAFPVFEFDCDPPPLYP